MKSFLNPLNIELNYKFFSNFKKYEIFLNAVKHKKYNLFFMKTIKTFLKSDEI